ncbi:hypothetical protein EVAR_99834_1 [Eumeta japonica]|uniref:Uncharacterized protein n=1 Tax=Eumeta variegata TaxID=151549 RepID=A0A4C1ZHC9_EUMVA|nr:hypothetical protein EVAR_99834_1 [Eumeta japonica]
MVFNFLGRGEHDSDSASSLELHLVLLAPPRGAPNRLIRTKTRSQKQLELRFRVPDAVNPHAVLRSTGIGSKRGVRLELIVRPIDVRDEGIGSISKWVEIGTYLNVLYEHAT